MSPLQTGACSPDAQCVSVTLMDAWAVLLSFSAQLILPKKASWSSLRWSHLYSQSRCFNLFFSSHQISLYLCYLNYVWPSKSIKSAAWWSIYKVIVFTDPAADHPCCTGYTGLMCSVTQDIYCTVLREGSLTWDSPWAFCAYALWKGFLVQGATEDVTPWTDD